MKQTYKLIFIALLLIGLCISPVAADYINMTPVMTSNTAPGTNSTVAVSQYSVTFAAFKAFDRSFGSFWSPVDGFVPSDATPAWLQINLSYPIRLSRYTIIPADPNNGPMCWTVSASNNSFVTSVVVDSRIDEVVGGRGTYNHYDVAPERQGTYTSFRLSINKTANNARPTLYELVLWISSPTSNFSAFSTAGTSPFTTYLYDTSTNLTGSETFGWVLGDGNTSTSKNLYFTWNKTGTYTVNHSVSNGVTTSYSQANVTVGTPTPPVVAPVASFYGSPTTGNVPLTVSFTDVSSNTPTSWNWSFGDGVYSELQNPTHAYTRSGFRTVNLTATNSAGSNITVRLKFVRVS